MSNRINLKALRSIVREEVQRLHRSGRLHIMEQIKYTTQSHGGSLYKVIDVGTLQRLAPEAVGRIDEDDLNIIWIMTSKPEPMSEPDETGFSDEWTETNEPELAESIAQSWDELAINVDGEQVVILCGSLDDEYGYFWNSTTGRWENYSY